jgi:hypothetical protein
MIRPTFEELAACYRSMPEEQLVKIGQEYEGLTEIAQAALRAEFSSRKLEPPELSESIARPKARQVAVVGRYRDLIEAQVAKSVLESAGISCYLRDENTIRSDWAWSNFQEGFDCKSRQPTGNRPKKFLPSLHPMSFRSKVKNRLSSLEALIAAR